MVAFYITSVVAKFANFLAFQSPFEMPQISGYPRIQRIWVERWRGLAPRLVAPVRQETLSLEPALVELRAEHQSEQL